MNKQIKCHVKYKNDVKCAEKALLPLGINMVDRNGNYRPFSEVFNELGESFYNIRESIQTEEDKKQFEIMRRYVLQCCVGIRYANQFMY